MKRTPILNPAPAIKLPFPSGKTHLYIGDGDSCGDDAGEGDVFLNRKTGYTSILLDKKEGTYSAVRSQHVTDISDWLEEDHPDLHKNINWDGDAI